MKDVLDELKILVDRAIELRDSGQIKYVTQEDLARWSRYPGSQLRLGPFEIRRSSFGLPLDTTQAYVIPFAH